MKPAVSEKTAPRVRPDSSWPTLIQNSAHEVFQLMVGSAIRPHPNPPAAPIGNISAIVGMAGNLCAVFSLRCDEKSAFIIAQKMLGDEEVQTLESACDAMAEICNMVAGNFKFKIAGLADGCALSVPTVVKGEDYHVRSQSPSDRIDVCMEYEEKPLFIMLEAKN